MAWNPQDHAIDLMVEQQGGAKHPTYRLTGWTRHTTRTGQVYMQPLPNFWALRDVTFTSIGAAALANTTEGGNELSLTRSNNAGRFGGRKA